MSNDVILPELAAQSLTAAGDAIVTVDAQGRITSWNPAAETLLGYRADQAIGQTLALIIPTIHRARHIAAFRTAMQRGALAHSGRPARVEATTTEGQTIPLAMSLGLLRGTSNAAVGAVAVLRRTALELEPFVSSSTQP